MPSTEERLETVRKRLTPAVRTAIERAIALDRVPQPLRPVIASPALDVIGQGLRPAAAQPEAFGLEALPTPVAGLEAIVQRFGRPPLLVRDDVVVMEELDDFPPGTDALIRNVEPKIGSVGRIEFLNHALAWGGTGWVVKATNAAVLVVTNRHVAALVAKRKANGSATFLRSLAGPKYGAKIDFIAEAVRDNDSRTAPLTGIEYLADDTAADVALLKIEAADFELPTPLELNTGGVRAKDLVAVIGYPAFDSRNDADDQSRYFRDLFEVKRFAPGFVMHEPDGSAIFSHDCTTLGGNSGSPLLGLEDGKVVGLHFSGLYGKNNSAVSAATLAALLRGERPVASRLPETFAERPDDHHAAEHFADRDGFVTSFLGGTGVATPWPGLPPEIVATLALPSDGPKEPNELRYRHFGVKYCGQRKLPIVTAVNIDGARTVRIKRGDDQWFTDGRIRRDIQLVQGNFADPSIDRGHMVRREDPNWGERAEAQQANDDTFHYVNAAAQHSGLNQSKAFWLGLESYILDSARVHGLKACVFTGPVLRDADEEDEVVIDGAIVPREFWKLVVTLNADDHGLHATAYLLSQGEMIRKLLEKRCRREGLEGFTLGAFRTFQISVTDLADATGYDLTAYVAADPLRKASAGAEAIDRGEPVFVPLETPDDLRL